MKDNKYYDKLIDDNNDPYYDSPHLKEYMDKWDGKVFIDSLKLNDKLSVLEIGIGTGRLACKVAPKCLKLTGIDISLKTIKKATLNLSRFKNIELICSDFITYIFNNKFDVIYSSLTFMHFKDKEEVINKISNLLVDGGLLCLSIDKNQENYILYGDIKIEIYPDNLDNIINLLKNNSMKIDKILETEFAYIVVSIK